MLYDMARARPEIPTSDAVRSEWLRRVEAEYHSAAVTQHLTLWLIQIGASPDLVHAGLRVVGDEMTHAEMSHAAYLDAGGHDVPKIDRDVLQIRRHPHQPLENDVVRTTVSSFCLGETIAVPLFKLMRDGCTAPPARRVLDRVLRDEVRHRDFGWTLLGWLFELPSGASLRAIAVAELPLYFARLRLSYGASELHKNTLAPEDRAWGLLPPAEYAGAVERSLTRDWIPRFGALGVDAKAAWDAAPV